MFYRLEEDLIQANQVYSGDYILVPEFFDKYEYPVDNWYWFETEEEARQHFNLPPLEVTE